MYKLFLVLLLITVFSFTAFASAELEPAAKDKAGNIEEQVQPASVKAKIDAYQTSRGRAVLNEGFESGAIPINWTVHNVDGGVNSWEATTVNPHTGTYAARIKYETSSLQNDDWLITPPLNIQAGVTDSLKFWVRTHSGTYADPFEVRLSTTGTDPADFTTLLFDTTGYMGTYEQLKFALDAYDGNVVYVGIHYTGAYEWYCYVDDFEGPEVYVAPEPVFFTAMPHIDVHEENGAYSNVGDVLDGFIYVTNTGGADLVISAINSSTPDLVPAVSSLTIAPGATDSVGVTWTPTANGVFNEHVEFVSNAASSPDTVTAQLIVVPSDGYHVNFEDPVDTWRSPAGYNFTLTFPSIGYTTSNNHWGAQAYWKGGAASQGGDTTYLWTPRLDLTSGPTEVGFFYKGLGASADDTVEVLVSTDDGATWTQIGKVTNDVPYTYVNYDLSAYAGNDNVKIGWHYYYPTGVTSGGSWYMDDIHMPNRWVSPNGVLYASADSLAFGLVDVGDSSPLSVGLTNTGGPVLNITSITSDNPAFVITAAPTSIASLATEVMEVSFVPSVTGPQTATITIDHDGTNGTETLLTIGASGDAVNRIASTFPYVQNFDTTNALPFGWTNDQNDSGKDWKFGSSAGHGAGSDHTTGSGYFTYLDDSSPNPTDASILVSRPMDLSGLSSPEMSFWYWSFMDGGSATPGYMLTDVWDGSNWVQVDSIGQEEELWKNKVIDLTPYKSAFVKVRFRVFETPSYYHDICIDDFEVYENAASPYPTHAIDFEPAGIGAGWNWIVGENATNPPLEFVANPAAGGINTSATVAKFTALQAGAPWALTHTGDDGEFTFDATNAIVKIMVYKTVISDVGFKVEGLGPVKEIVVPNTLTNQWEELTFDFSSEIGNSFNRLVIIPDFDFTPRAQDNIVYFDNIMVPDGYVPPPPPEPTVAAPVPTHPEADVISIFSDVYTDLPGTNFNPNWGQATQVSFPIIQGDTTLLYSSLNYQGTEFTNQNVTGYDFLHVDFWTADTNGLEFFLISPGGLESPYTLPITAEQWVSVEIPLTHYAPPVNLADVFQFKVVGSGNVYLDNLYFYKDASGPQKLLITEFVVGPTEAEFIEIFNPNTDPVDLTDYYLTDATYAGGNTYYYQIVEGGGGGGGFSDWHARFPAGATIAAGEYQTMAIAGDSLFFDVYGVLPTYELFEDSTNFANDVPDMLEAFPGSINGQGGLTGGDEFMVLYHWDGMTDLVGDVDYVIYDNAGQAPNESVDKTGIKMDGPDAGTDSTMYLDDTPIASQVPAVSPANGFSSHRIDYAEGTQTMTGGNGVTGADETSENLDVTFTDWSNPSPNGPYVEPWPAGTILLEDFEGGVLPADWTASAAATSLGWLVGDSAALSSQYWSIPAHGIFAAANDDAAGSGGDGSMDYLITPPMDFTAYAGIVLQFASYYDGAYSQLAYVEVSEDGGATWTQVHTLTPSPLWEMVSVDLSAYAGAGHDSVWVAFHADDAGGWASGWAVDDVVVKKQDVGGVSGIVTAATGGAPIDSAMVMLGSNTTYTDPTGAYLIDGVFVGDYELTVVALGFNVATIDTFTITANTVAVQDFQLTAPTMDLDVAAIDTSATAGDSVTVPITISNNGDGPLDYSIAIVPVVVEETNYSAFNSTGTLETTSKDPVQKQVVEFKANDSRADTTIIHYDGPYSNNGIGTGGAADFACAVRFTAAELAAYYGQKNITGIQYHIRDAQFSLLEVKVWMGGSVGDPGVEVYSADVTATTTIGDWSEHTLSYPVPLISGQEYWIGYTISATGDHPASTDAGPIVPGKGAWIYFGGVWDELVNLNPALSYNWNIRGILETAEDPWLVVSPDMGNIAAGSSEVVNAVLNASVFPANTDTTVTAALVFAPDPMVGPAVVPVTFNVTPVLGIGGGELAVPLVFDLSPNYPNPFNPTTKIEYQIPNTVDVRMDVFNVLGQRVRTLVNANMEPGFYEVVWDGNNDFGSRVSSGIYVYRISAGDYVKSYKMILMK